MINKIKTYFRSRKTAPTTSELLMAESQLSHTVWLMLCGMSVEDENLTVTGIIDCVQ